MVKSFEFGEFDSLHGVKQYLESEGLKHGMEEGLHLLSGNAVGRAMIGVARHGRRVEDNRLRVNIAGLDLENPLLIAPGWDKRGRAVDGLYELGAAGTVVGTVLANPQKGNPKPRMWYRDGVSLNRMGFNSPGMWKVADNLDTQRLPGVVGISLGKNKMRDNSEAPEAHAEVASVLHEFADFFEINVSSPNTPNLRDFLSDTAALRDIIVATQEAVRLLGDKPIFLKTMVDLTDEQLDAVIQVCIDTGIAGIVDTNTTVDKELKSIYGWGEEMGGLSGNNAEYRRRANERMKFIARRTQGTGLVLMGVGGINTAEAAIERMKAGAHILQMLTAMRQSWGYAPTAINQGILNYLEKEGMSRVGELTGIDV